MAWSTPRTWVTDEVVTAAYMNAVRDDLAFLKGEDWQTPSLINGWAAYGSPYYGPRYKQVGKLVILRGLAQSGTVSTTPATGAIFILPAGYRPVERMAFAVQSNNLFGRCDVTEIGEVVAYIGSNVWFSLSPVKFPVI